MPPDSNVFASGPRKETARIGILPDPSPVPAAQLKKTQPLSRIPETIPAPAPFQIASTPEPDFVEQPVASDIPVALCWLLLGLSTVILLIQIWAYFF